MTRRGAWIGAVLFAALATGCSETTKSWFNRPTTEKSAGSAAGTDGAVTLNAPEAQNAKESPTPELLPETRLSAGKMLEAEGNMQGAIAQYREVLRGDPQNIDALVRLGIAHNRLQQFEEAIRCFHRAIEIDPRRAYLHNNLGFSYVLAGRLDYAETSFRQALSLRPDYARARMNLGAVLAQSGRNDAAVAEFEKVVSRDAAFYNLGLILLADKRDAAAEEAFRHCLALNPSSQEAQRQLARLEAGRQSDLPATPGDPPAGSPMIVSRSDSGAGLSDGTAVEGPATSQPIILGVRR